MTERPKEIRKSGDHGSEDWEDGVDNQESARMHLDGITKALADHQIDIHKAHVLEIGSGRGRFLREMHNEGIDAVAVDARPRGVEHTGLVGARAEQLPFKDGEFDVIINQNLFDRRW